MIRRLVNCVLVAVIFAGGAQAKTTIKLGIGQSEGSFIHEIVVFIKNDFEKRIGADGELQIFAGGQIGNDTVILNGLRQGTHHVGLIGSPVAGIEKGFGIFEAPFLFANRDEVIRVTTGAVGRELLNRLRARGIEGLAIGEIGFRQITNNVRPIVRPEDLKGLKIRIPNSPFRAQTFKHFGATATPIAFGETYAALRQGVVDGQENPLATTHGERWHEVQKFVSLTNHLFTPIMIMASKSSFDAWPRPVQDALRKAAEAAAQFSFRRGEELDRKYLEEMTRTAKTNQIDAAAFRKASAALHGSVAEQAGKDLMDQVLAQLAK